MEKHAICYLSVVPVRAEASDKSEMVTQLVFGDLCEILEENEAGNWSRIKIDSDDYEGWVDSKQLFEIDMVSYHRYKREKPIYVLEELAKVNTGDKLILLPIGARLPFFEKGYIEVGNVMWQFLGRAGHYDKNEVLRISKLFIGVPYLWGGKTQFGIDCSGFVQQVFRACKKQLPRDANQQVNEGVEVSFLDVKVGDLAFFSNASGKVIHVGIVIENHNIIHAHGEVRIDVLDEKGIYNTSRKTYSHNLSSLKSIFY